MISIFNSVVKRFFALKQENALKIVKKITLYEMLIESSFEKNENYINL